MIVFFDSCVTIASVSYKKLKLSRVSVQRTMLSLRLMSRAVCSQLIHSSVSIRPMSTYKFDDPNIQARFDEKKARRERVIAQDAEDVFDKYLHILATRRDGSCEARIEDENLTGKSDDEIKVMANLLQQKDKKIDVTYKFSWSWCSISLEWVFNTRDDKRSQ